MNLLKKFFKLIYTAAVSFAFSVPAKADSVGLGAAPETSDKGIIISILVAVAAFIMTAFITTKLTKYKNK